MNYDNYTALKFKRKNLSKNGITSYLEPMLLSFFVAAGIIGSAYLFGHNILFKSSANLSGNNPYQLQSAAIPYTSDFNKSDFDAYIKFPKVIKVNEKLYFSFLKDFNASRYVLEMGDGVRLIITQSELEYTYNYSGKYTLELKEIKDGLLTIIGTKTITVK